MLCETSLMPSFPTHGERNVLGLGGIGSKSYLFSFMNILKVELRDVRGEPPPLPLPIDKTLCAFEGAKSAHCLRQSLGSLFSMYTCTNSLLEYMYDMEQLTLNWIPVDPDG